MRINLEEGTEIVADQPQMNKSNKVEEETSKNLVTPSIMAIFVFII